MPFNEKMSLFSQHLQTSAAAAGGRTKRISSRATAAEEEIRHLSEQLVH